MKITKDERKAIILALEKENVRLDFDLTFEKTTAIQRASIESRIVFNKNLIEKVSKGM